MATLGNPRSQNERDEDMMPVTDTLTIYGHVMIMAGDDPDSVEMHDTGVTLTKLEVNEGIRNGSLKAGIFNRVHVEPSRNLWPNRWLFLKDPEPDEG
jgi:hypothetical protein